VIEPHQGPKPRPWAAVKPQEGSLGARGAFPLTNWRFCCRVSRHLSSADACLCVGNPRLRLRCTASRRIPPSHTGLDPRASETPLLDELPMLNSVPYDWTFSEMRCVARLCGNILPNATGAGTIRKPHKTPLEHPKTESAESLVGRHKRMRSERLQCASDDRLQSRLKPTVLGVSKISLP